MSESKRKNFSSELKAKVALEARKLYRETDASREQRAFLAVQLKAKAPLFVFKGRPSKRDRRQIAKFKKHGEQDRE